MGEGEAAVNLGFVGVFRGEKGVELVLGIDPYRVLVPVGGRAGEKCGLNVIQNGACVLDELRR